MDVSHGFMGASPFHVSPMTSSKNPTAAGGGPGGQCSLKPYNGGIPTPVSPLYSTPTPSPNTPPTPRPTGGAVQPTLGPRGGNEGSASTKKATTKSAKSTTKSAKSVTKSAKSTKSGKHPSSSHNKLKE
jgi:hypothetical protein